MTHPVRGQVYRADLGFGLKPWLIVSNNQRNRVLSDVVAARITTTSKELPTWVALSQGDPLVGYVNCDALETIGKDEFGDYLGSLAHATLRRVNDALTVALGIP